MASFQTMGIVNLTPDSFSDGGEVACATSLRDKVSFLLSHGSHILDFGAASTAPTATPTSKSRELERFGLLLECFPSLELGQAALSIDTYRPSVFAHLHGKLKDLGFKGEIIWNDVSGVVDEETWALLREHPTVSYILTYAHIPTKEETPRHRDFIREDAGRPFRAITALKEALLKLSFVPPEKLILDLGFGFSKTPEQNWALLSQLGPILKAFGPGARWCFGLSRKSMFQKLFPEDKNFFYCEMMHLLALNHILSHRKAPIFRIHDPRLTQSLGIFTREI